MKKKIILLSSIIGFILLTGCTSTNKYPSSEEQNKIAHLTQTGIHYYWHGGDLSKVEKEFFKGITLKGKYDVVENSFKEASLISPYRTDLRFSIASTQIIQKKTEDALNTYKDILAIYPDNFEAGILLAGYSKQIGDMQTYSSTIENLKKTHPEKTQTYLNKFENTDKNMNIQLNTEAFKVNDNHAIVILGYALGDNGVMKPTLIERLKQGLALHRKNPRSPIIVSGGVQKGGVTEAFVMKNWLVSNGVPSYLIYMDDQAKDTVGNALYSTEILANLAPKNVTLISSASHIRRGLSVFEEAASIKGLKLKYTNLVHLDYPTLKEAQKVSEAEKLVIYRDLIRTSGIWAYPGIQQ
ncbi:YdcF family protein [Cetobacterium sp. 8H]|uniref:YdcF family protein n=1 Tax=Cetobacterium sp. 8H TaxID=2759681 RepID=UPI00163CD609|nr:YdcF family protein [Cetobacterium sp. 8H]MBC2850138.1 YdcF family protein [Cetobacterium sp. 8H]